MSDASKRTWLNCLIGLLVFLIATAAGDALAAEEAAHWRPMFDLVMRWVNFLILVSILVKFGRKPLMEMLTGKKLEISIEIKKLEEAKKELNAKLRGSQKALEESSARLEQLKERVIQLGERRKQEIIEDARQESQIILDSAQRKIEGRILRAKHDLRAEMVDAAMDLAMKRLPELVTADDNRKWVEEYLKIAASS
jgi:F-type H+-transporting ATPase subunit b